ncbi:MAG: DUF3568 family protein [Opitutaceae bacterium]|jgi:hypothetical protein
MSTKLSLKIIRAAALAGLTSVAVTQSGCLLVAAGAVAGAGAVVYVRGELQASLDSGYESVKKATNRAIDQLQFKKISESKDALKDVLIARTADDTKVEITIIKVSEVLTKVEIRVGVFGDQAVSMTILEKIKKGL